MLIKADVTISGVFNCRIMDPGAILMSGFSTFPAVNYTSLLPDIAISIATLMVL